ncbi:MAG: MFS transporter, partial [Muribaculaceae bacterium]|nr:MFS transporter [Muribaculaceae bacterium]
KDVQIDTSVEPEAKIVKFSVRQNLSRIIFSGIPWACEGLAVYGFSVFLPVLVMALGIESSHTVGIHKIIDSVWVTAAVNFFILPGFILGLVMMRKVNNVKMLYTGFLFSAVGLVLLLVSYLLKWPMAWMLAGFVIFELALNAGPHLITFIVPSRIYPVVELGVGNGIAAMIGKVGAVGGVILMPILLELGGMILVLGVSAGVMLLGAVIGMVYGKILKLV